MRPEFNDKTRTIPIKNILCFEVEDRFHVESPDVESTEERSRIIPILIHLLDLLDEQKATATFFVLGWVAKKFPEIVALIDARGHEVASHGFSHGDIRTMPVEKLESELKRSREILEQILEKPVFGFKAASERLRGENLPLYRKIAAAGYRYDCSLKSHSTRWVQNQPVEMKFEDSLSLVALPQSTVRKWGLSLGFTCRLRLFPFWFVKRAIQSLNRQGQFAMINLKLWELNHHQKRPASADFTNYTEYGNLNLAEEKLLRLLNMFEFGTCAGALGISARSDRAADI